MTQLLKAGARGYSRSLSCYWIGLVIRRHQEVRQNPMEIHRISNQFKYII